MTRYRLQLALTVLALTVGLAHTHTRADAGERDTHETLVYVGMHGSKIHALRFDENTGKLTKIGPVAEGPKPTWITAHPQLPVLYAVDDDNQREGHVIAFSVDRKTGSLNKMNEVTTGGNGTTNLWLDLPSMTLLAANYASGSATTMAFNRDGSLGPLVSTVKATGSGPHRRQAGAHAHGVAIDPSGQYALVSDLGADRVFVYGFDPATHTLSPDDVSSPRSFVAPAGSGPRHLAFGLNGHFVYLLNELTADVMTLRWDAKAGRLSPVQALPTSSPEFQGTKSGSEIAVSHDGRFVYAANRSEHTLIVYRVNAETGELAFVQRTSSGGEVPWGFAIHRSGKWMLVANQRSNTVNVFSIDLVSGMVSATGQSAESPTPVSVTFLGG